MADCLTEEQKLRIERNKQDAINRRMDKKKLEENENLEMVIQGVLNELVSRCEQLVELDIRSRARCEKCGSSKIENDYLDAFDVKACKSCIYNNSEYSLLPKSDLAKKYLLGERHIKDLKFMKKSNPKKIGWNPMKLYLEKQVSELARTVWGNQEKLEKELSSRKQRKFQSELLKTSDALKRSMSQSENILQSATTADTKRARKANRLKEMISIVRGDNVK